MSAKKRVLIDSEYSLLTSGYSKVSKEILSRLHSMNKYELAELASYCSPDDQSMLNLPWKVYPVLPNPNNQDEINEYNSHPHNVSGRHKFNHAILDFNPDVVISYRDYWYQAHISKSPYRRLYSRIGILPVDSIPQMPEWLDDSIDCEACYTYTDFGYDVLKKQCGDRENLKGPFRLCADTTKFFPIWNKKKLKEHFNFQDECLIVGFVARNQYRKLFDDVFQAFTNFLLQAPQNLAAKTYLYIHSGWPDIHVKFPQLLCEYGITSKVLFTYFCKNCGEFFPSTYSDVTCACRFCNGPASLPKPTDSKLDETKLNIIYNFFDLYIANFTNEGIGLPPLEAMCCAVPTAVTNFSGAEDLVNLCGAIPLNNCKLRRESELHRLFAVPDNNDLAGKLIEILSLPDMIRRKIGFEQYQKTIKNFNWDTEIQKLVACLDTLPNKNWKAPLNVVKPNLQIPENLSQEQYVWWLYNHIEGRPELFHKYEGLKKIYALTMGFIGEKPNFQGYSKEIALNEAISNNKHNNHWEIARGKKFGLI